jgi:hypothetical protein
VLRLSRDPILIGLAPSELSIVRLSGAWRRRIVAAQAIDCDPAFGVEPWQGALTALRQIATSLTGEAADVTIVLSNHFVRYAIVPWSDALDNADEELAFARHTFARIHGERARLWEVRIGDEATGAARLASGIDRGLFDALRACFPSSGKARVVSVQPHLMSAFNHWRRRLARDAWFLVVEPQRACITLRSKGRWTAVRTARGEFDDAAAWVDLLERERYRVEADAPDEVAVFAPRNAKAVFPEAGRWKFTGLMMPPADGPAATDLSRFALALSAR